MEKAIISSRTIIASGFIGRARQLTHDLFKLLIRNYEHGNPSIKSIACNYEKHCCVCVGSRQLDFATPTAISTQ